jgi:hypothetical protein
LIHEINLKSSSSWKVRSKMAERGLIEKRSWVEESGPSLSSSSTSGEEKVFMTGMMRRKRGRFTATPPPFQIPPGFSGLGSCLKEPNIPQHRLGATVVRVNGPGQFFLLMNRDLSRRKKLFEDIQ